MCSFSQDTVRDLKKKLHALKRSLHPDRQRMTLHPKDGEARGAVLEDGKRIKDCGLKDGASVIFKDLGPQARRRWHAWSCCPRVTLEPLCVDRLLDGLFLGVFRSARCLSAVLPLSARPLPGSEVSVTEVLDDDICVGMSLLMHRILSCAGCPLPTLWRKTWPWCIGASTT